MVGRRESSCGARRESQRDPLDTSRVGSSSQHKVKAMLGVQSVTNRSCSEVRSEPSLPKEQRKDKVLTNQGKSQNPVPAGATSVPKLPPSTSRPRGVRQHWGDALPSREGKERWGWDSTGSPRHSPGADPGWNSSSRSTHSSEV